MAQLKQKRVKKTKDNRISAPSIQIKIGRDVNYVFAFCSFQTEMELTTSSDMTLSVSLPH